MTTLTLDQQRQDIMDRFDFNRVLTAMHALNWTWVGQVVTLDDLKGTASELIDTIIAKHTEDRQWTSCATGGFEASIDIVFDQPRLSLLFYVTQCDARSY